MTRPLQTVFLPSWVDACALWRMYMPYQNIPGSSFFAFADPVFPLIVNNDVAVVQRCYSQAQLNFINVCKQARMKVIYDLDDDVWHVPPANPAHEMLTRMKNGFGECMRVVDLITVSTKPLAQIVRQELKKTDKRARVEVIVVENRIDTKLFATPRKKEEVIVGWAGSSSHMGIEGKKGSGDLGIIEDVICGAIAEHPDVTFQFRGGKPTMEVLNAGSNVEYKPWSPVSEYAARMPLWGWSVALSPLTMEQFNNCKSPIKMIEAGYCSIPCLVSHVDPYDRFASFDGELRWLLCSTEQQWRTKLRELIRDAARRQELGARMHAVMKRYFSFSREHEGWERAMRMVM